MPEQSPWPPPNYYTTFGPFSDPFFQVHLLHPIDPSWPITVDGERVTRYQLPLAPVEIGKVLISGYIRSTDDGKLLDGENNEVGEIDHDTGILSINVELSPELGDRRAEFFYPRKVAPAC
jgi:hypothetical protein